MCGRETATYICTHILFVQYRYSVLHAYMYVSYTFYFRVLYCRCRRTGHREDALSSVKLSLSTDRVCYLL